MVRAFWRYLSLLVTFPVFLLGFITNILPYYLPVRMARGIKDPQFLSSVKAGLGFLFVFPVMYLLWTLAFALISGLPWWTWILFILSLLPLGQAALAWYLRWKKTVRGSWFRRQLRRKKSFAWDLVNLRKEIIEETAELITS